MRRPGLSLCFAAIRHFQDWYRLRTRRRCLATLQSRSRHLQSGCLRLYRPQGLQPLLCFCLPGPQRIQRVEVPRWSSARLYRSRGHVCRPRRLQQAGHPAFLARPGLSVSPAGVYRSGGLHLHGRHGCGVHESLFQHGPPRKLLFLTHHRGPCRHRRFPGHDDIDLSAVDPSHATQLLSPHQSRTYEQEVPRAGLYAHGELADDDWHRCCHCRLQQRKSFAPLLLILLLPPQDRR